MEPVLQSTFLTWITFILTVLVWAYSYKLAALKNEQPKWGWRIVPMSVFGCAWIAFGVTYIFRYFVLAYDPELYRATQYPLWFMPGDRLTEIWLFIGLFWGVFCLGFYITNRY